MSERVPDVSEQRAEVEAAGFAIMDRNCDLADRWPPPVAWREARADAEVAIAAYFRRVDPASVLAALLAESPEATVAAIEALLTTDEVLDETAAAFSALDHLEAVLPPSERSGPYEYARFMFDAACRSLLSKAPKGDGDA